jgi:hypothetical protein
VSVFGWVPSCWVAGCLLTACGAEVAYRPLAVEIQNVAVAAETVTLKVFPSDTRPCDSVVLTNVQTLETAHTATWIRSSGQPRELTVPRLAHDRVSVVVYTEDAGGAAIQLACTEVRFADIETSRITVRLPRALASIMHPWRTCSARSSSSG